MLFANIMQDEINQLSNMTADKQAEYLMKNLDSIAQKAVNQGFDSSVYQPKKSVLTGFLHFTRHPLWEGSYFDIPLSLFVYQWPPEKEALKLTKGHGNQQNWYYRSNIHGHDIPCVFTVLSGSVTQILYEEVPNHPDRVVRETRRSVLTSGCLEFDDNSAPFVHQVICQHEDSHPAITIHGYGAMTAVEVEKNFMDTFEEMSYRHVIKDDGSVQKQPW